MTKRARQSELRRSTKSIDLFLSTSDVSDADVAEVLAPSSVAQSFSGGLLRQCRAEFRCSEASRWIGECVIGNCPIGGLGWVRLELVAFTDAACSLPA